MLSLGLFYHLTHQEGRLRAAIELERVLSSGGHAFVAYMPRTTLLRCLVARTTDAGEWHQGELREARIEGKYTSREMGHFTEGYYPVPSEMQSLLSSGHANGSKRRERGYCC